MKKSHSANDSEEFFREDDGGGDLLLPRPPACGASSLPSAHSESQGAMCQPILGGGGAVDRQQTATEGSPQPRLSVASSWHLISGAPRGGLWARACRSLPLRGALWPCRLQQGVPRGSPALLPEPGPSVRRPPGRLCPGVSAVLNHTYSVLRPPCSPLRPASPCRGSSTAGGQGRVYQRGGRRPLEELRGS